MSRPQDESEQRPSTARPSMEQSAARDEERAESPSTYVTPMLDSTPTVPSQPTLGDPAQWGGLEAHDMQALPSGQSTARHSLVSTLPPSAAPSNVASPEMSTDAPTLPPYDQESHRPPPLTVVQPPSAETSPQPAAEGTDQMPSTPTVAAMPTTSVDPPLQSPATIGAPSTTNHSTVGHPAASSTSVLLPTFTPFTHQDESTVWRVPASQLRPETAELDDEDGQRPMRTFAGDDLDALSDKSSSADEGGVFAFNRPRTGSARGPKSRKRKRPPTTSHGQEKEFQDNLGGGACLEEVPPYDPSNPPPLSGKNNPNNGPFIDFRRWQNTHSRDHNTTPLHTVSAHPRPMTSQSRVSVASSAPPSTFGDHDDPRYGGHVIPGESFGGHNRHTTRTGHTDHTLAGDHVIPDGVLTSKPTRRRVQTRDEVSFIDGSVITDSDGHSLRVPPTRGSVGFTDATGDMTVPDGHTTWGDGQGGVLKGGSDDEPEFAWEEDSPYAEVRASVSNIDDPDMPALTLRAFSLGMLLGISSSCVNTFLSFRNPQPQLPVLFVQLIAYPLGKFLAWAMPLRDYQLPRWLGGVRFSLNPCPFNVKEHTIIVMMANVTTVPAYGLYTLVTAGLFYNRELGVGFGITYILATQVTGFSLAGLCRRFVVWPSAMIWPGVLLTTTILNTMHAESDTGTGGISRWKFFVYAATAAAFYCILPGFLFTALSYFSFACWIAPTNHKVNQLMGISTGLGMSILTFDWAQIAWIGSPLVAPWWAQVNIGIGFLFFYWFLTPIMYYTNVWYTRYLPIFAIQPADRFQQTYDVMSVMTPDHKLNVTHYEKYSPVYITAAFSMTYMLAFALTTALITYTALHHGKRLWNAVRNIKTDPDDIHLKLMERYPEVPDWWYGITFVICGAIGIVSVRVFDTGLPVYGYFIAIAMPLLYLIPIGIIYAMSNLEPTFNIIAELIPGYLFPGQPIPGMIFKTFAIQTLAEALYFVRDMKLGHYMKVPPRSMFICQMAACTFGCFVQVGIKELMFRTIPDLCQPTQKSLLICLNAKTGFTSSIVWGLIGPARLFSRGAIYNPQLWMMLVGAIVPIPLWWWTKKYPRSSFRNINITLVLSICLVTPPASGMNIASFLVVGFVFQFWLRRYSFAWWARYNYVLSAALEVGTLVCILFIFLVFGLPKVTLSWWGNEVYKNTADWRGEAFDPLPEKGYFGPSTWKLY